MKNNTRPGLKTTEFWLALIVTIVGSIAAVYADTDIGRTAGMVSAALAAAGYGFKMQLAQQQKGGR